MAETTNLIQQAKSGKMSLEGLRQFSQGTPNITQTQTPDIAPTNIRPDAPQEQAAPSLGGLQQFMEQQAPPQPVPTAETVPATPEELAQPSFMQDVVLETGKELAGGIGRGVLYGISEMSDIIKTGLDRALFVQPIIGAVTGNRPEDLMTLTEHVKAALPPESKEFGNRVAVEVGRALPMIATMGGATSHVAQTGSKIPFILRGMTDDLARLGPRQLAMLEGTMAIAGGAGGEAAVDARQGLGLDATPKWIWQMAGSLISSIGLNSAVNLTKRAQAAATRTVTKSVERAEQKIGQALEKQAPKGIPEFEPLRKEAAELEAAIPGYKLGLAETTREPGYERMTTQMIGASPELAEAAVGHTMRSAKAIRRVLKHAESEADLGDVDALNDRVVAHLSGIEQEVAKQINEAQAPMQQIQAQVTGNLGAPAVALREAAETADKTLSALAKELFTKPAQQVGTAPIFNFRKGIGGTIRGIKRESKKSLFQYDKVAERSAVLSELEQSLANPQPLHQTYGYMRDIIAKSNEEIKLLDRSLKMGTGSQLDSAAISSLKKVRSAAEKQLDRLETGFLAKKYPGAAQDLKDAKALFKEATTDVRSGFFRVMSRVDKAGQRTIDESIAIGDKLLKSSEKTESFLRVVGGFGKEPGTALRRFENPEALAEIENYALESFVKRTTKNGKVDTNLMKKWLKDHEGIKQIPGLQNKLQNAAKAQQTVDELIKGKIDVQAMPDRAAPQELLTTDDMAVLRNFTNGAHPQAVVNEIMKSRNPVQGINALAKVAGSDDAAMRGLRKSVWQHMENTIDTPPGPLDDFPLLNAQNMRKYLDDYKPVLKQLYKPEQLETLEIVQRASARTSREAQMTIRPAGNPKLEGDIQKMTHWITTIVNRVLPGRSSLAPNLPYTIESATTARILNSFSEKQQAALLHAAKNVLFDTEAADLLKKGAQNINNKLFLNRLASYAELHSNAVTGVEQTLLAWKQRKAAKKEKPTP